MTFSTAVSSAFVLVFLAEFGDKSQLVCMALAAKHRALPVVSGAMLAFSVLNLLAVTLGVLVAQWLPSWVVLMTVGVLFVAFGLQALRTAENESVGVASASVRSAMLAAFSVIFLAELGDKTQVLTAGLAAAEGGLSAWLGSTLALFMTTLLGVLAGKAISRWVSVVWMHRIAGMVFLVFAVVAFYKVWGSGFWMS